MPSSTSSSDPRLWRRFFRLLVAVAGGSALFVYLFVVLTDPFGSLPVSFPFHRWPVDGNARYSFPLLARSPQFDSAVFGTSTSRLFKPAALDAIFDAHFANLAMNSATPYEQSRLLDVFLSRHPAPRAIVVGLDVQWCVDPGQVQLHARDFPFPDWLYEGSRWIGYLHMADLYSIERAGQAFAEFTGLKRRVYGLDGYTRFVPDESRYDPVRVAQLMAEASPWQPPGNIGPDPESWQMPTLDLLRSMMARLPPQTRKVLMFNPVSFRLSPAPDTAAGRWLAECKRRVATTARDFDHSAVVDFDFHSPITGDPNNYWDAWHTRVGIADRVVADLGRALVGSTSADYRLLEQNGAEQVGDRGSDQDTRRVQAHEPEQARFQH